MSADYEQGESSSSSAEKQLLGGEEDERKMKCSDEEEAESLFASRDTMSRQSLVHTATRDSLFTEKTTPTKPHVLSQEWVYGMNPLLPVFNLEDPNQVTVLYAGANDGILYNHTLKSQHILRGHSQLISSMCVSEDQRWIATADLNCTVMIWDSYSGIPVQTIFDCYGDGGVIAMAFSEDKTHLVTLGAGHIQYVCIWDWTNDVHNPLLCTKLHPGHGFQDYILFNPTDDTQMLSSSKSHVLFYSSASGYLIYSSLKLKKLSETPELADASLCRSVFNWRKPEFLSATGGTLVVCKTADGLTANQSIPHERLTRLVLQEHPITVLTVTDSYMATGDTQGYINVYDERYILLACYFDLNLDAIVSISFPKESAGVSLVKFDLDGKPINIRNFVVSTVTSTVVYVSALSGTPYILLQEDYQPVNTVACHPYQPAVITGNEKGLLKVWDYNNKEVIGSREFGTDKQIQCITFDPQGLYLAIGFGNGAVHIVNPETLESDPEECFHLTTDAIHLITFSSDSKYLATADAGKAVTVFCLGMDQDSLPRWTYLGRHRSHYKPIKDLLFGVHLDSTQPRLLSLGMDRRLVDYDLENSFTDQLCILSSERIEQSAVPLCMTWYPPITTEQFLLTASDQYKMKLFNSTTKMCRKTLLGPTYGSPIKQIAVLPKSKEPETTSHYLAFITNDKVGIQILPLDGNPFRSNAVACHPTGVSAFACSHDGQRIFTAGGSDCTVLSWKINRDALEAAATLGGKDLDPFYSLLEGGRDGKLNREMEDFFYCHQVCNEGNDVMCQPKIPLSVAPSIMRALAYCPTEQEIEDMQNEVKFSRYAETGKYVTDIDLAEFLKLYVNHRPAFGHSINELTQAFHVLGHHDNTGLSVLQTDDLRELLQARGEHMTEAEVSDCFETLLSLREGEEEEEEEEDEKEEGGESIVHDRCDSRESQASLECEIPAEISMKEFIHILGFPSPPE